MTTSELISLICSGVQALAMLLLVGVTIYYARQTKKTVDAMDRNNKIEFLPVMMIGIDRQLSNERKLSIILQNVGNGLAKRPVKFIFPGVAPIFVNSILPKCISPEEEQSINIDYDIDYVLSLEENDRKMIVEYQDVFGTCIKTEAFLKEAHNAGVTGKERCLTFDEWRPIIP